MVSVNSTTTLQNSRLWKFFTSTKSVLISKNELRCLMKYPFNSNKKPASVCQNHSVSYFVGYFQNLYCFLRVPCIFHLSSVQFSFISLQVLLVSLKKYPVFMFRHWYFIRSYFTYSQSYLVRFTLFLQDCFLFKFMIFIRWADCAVLAIFLIPLQHLFRGDLALLLNLPPLRNSHSTRSVQLTKWFISLAPDFDGHCL